MLLCLRQFGVLPGAIVERPKFNDWRIADGLDDVNMVLADIFGFTLFTNRHSPDKVFSLLDEVCAVLDDLAGPARSGKYQEPGRCLYGGGRFNYTEFGTCPVSG
jgi:hypothetical protein